MMDNKTLCPLVQDLLPSLADGIASPESERLMREHMETCKECRDMFTDMCPTEDVSSQEMESIFMEKFIRKWKIRKLAVWSMVCVLLLGMTGITVYAISARNAAAFYPGVQFQENISVRGEGYMLGENPQPVSVAVDGAMYRNTLHPEEPDTSFGWDHVSVCLADGTFLFDNNPYGEMSLHQWVPVQNDGSIHSPLVISHMKDYRQYVFHGTLYARNRMDDFILVSNNYFVCYPCSSEEEAVRMAAAYVQEFDLYETSIWEYICTRYPEYTE